MPPRDAFYAAVRLASRPVFALWFRLRRHGVANVPCTGAVIVAANHWSYLDPAVVGSTFPRPIRFLIHGKVWAHPTLNWFYRAMRSIPVSREGASSRATIRRSLDALRAGEAVGIFPEGGRRAPGHGEPPLVGVALLARQSGAPVIPCGIRGTDRCMPIGAAFPRPHRVDVSYGRPLRHVAVAGTRAGVSGRDGDARFTQDLMSAIARLSAPESRE